MDIYRNLMVGSVNKAILLGNLGRDPEIRSMQSGAKMASFSIATSKRWKDRNTQEQKEKTSWHNIVVFGDGLVDIVEKYVKKGSKIYVEGEIQTRKWQDKDGNDRYTTEILGKEMNMLGVRQSSGDSGEFDQSQPASQTAQSHDNQISEEDIPF